MSQPNFDPNESELETFVIVPKDRLSKEAFHSLIHEFILREGTDYGHCEVTQDEKFNRVLSQIDAKQIKIVFSSKTENCTLMNSSEIPINTIRK